MCINEGFSLINAVTPDDYGASLGALAKRYEMQGAVEFKRLGEKIEKKRKNLS